MPVHRPAAVCGISLPGAAHVLAPGLRTTLYGRTLCIHGHGIYTVTLISYAQNPSAVQGSPHHPPEAAERRPDTAGPLLGQAESAYTAAATSTLSTLVWTHADGSGILQ